MNSILQPIRDFLEPFSELAGIDVTPFLLGVLALLVWTVGKRLWWRFVRLVRSDHLEIRPEIQAIINSLQPGGSWKQVYDDSPLVTGNTVINLPDWFPLKINGQTIPLNCRENRKLIAAAENLNALMKKDRIAYTLKVWANSPLSAVIRADLTRLENDAEKKP